VANNLRITPLALHTSSYSILMERRLSDSSGNLSNAISNASSMIGPNNTRDVLVLVTKLSAVQAVLRHIYIVSKAAVCFRLLCVKKAHHIHHVVRRHVK
jgi:hypothetical protein